MIDWSALMEKINRIPPLEGKSGTTVSIDLQKLPAALANVLDTLSEHWTVQAFVGGVEYDADAHTIRTHSSPENVLSRVLTPEEALAMCACKEKRWVATRRDADCPVESAGKGVTALTDLGIEEVFRRGDPQNALVCLVSQARGPRERIGPCVRSLARLQEEIDRIEQDLTRETQHSDANGTYHRIAESLYLLFMDDASQHLTDEQKRRPKSRKRPRVTLAEIYLGDSRIYGEYDGLPEKPQGLSDKPCKQQGCHSLQ